MSQVLVGSINGGQVGKYPLSLYLFNTLFIYLMSLLAYQASNLCTYIAKGDVALSVLMTTVTTIAGIFMTPLLCKLVLGAVVPVDAVGIAVSCMQVVLAPIIVGMAANK